MMNGGSDRDNVVPVKCVIDLRLQAQLGRSGNLVSVIISTYKEVKDSSTINSCRRN